MKIVNFQQRTSVWKAWRREGVSSSEVAVVLGESPYMTRWELWAQKKGLIPEPDLSQNPNVRRGIRNERKMMAIAEAILDEDFLLPISAECEYRPYIRVSLDGLTSYRIPVEAKCPSNSRWLDVLRYGQNSKTVIYYYSQVQQQIYVTQAPYAWLFVYGPYDNGDYRIFKIMRNDVYIRSLIDKIDEFMSYMKRKEGPPMVPERDLFVPSDVRDIDVWQHDALLYREAHRKQQKLNDELADLKQTMADVRNRLGRSMGAFHTGKYSGLRLSRVNPEGQINWEKLAKELLPNLTQETLEKYRDGKKPFFRATLDAETREQFAARISNQ